MNILFIAPRLPWPADTGGKIRTLNIIKQFLKFASLRLVCFSFEKGDDKWKEEMEKLGAQVTLVSARENSLLRKAWNINFEALPHSVIKYHSPQMHKVLKDLIAGEPFDAVHIDHLHMAQFAGSINGLPCYLDEHNVEYKILERCCDIETSGMKKGIYRKQALKMKLYETKIIMEFKGVFACSPDDKKILNGLNPRSVPLYLMPNGVDIDYFKAPDSQEDGEVEALVFTGSLDWLPNDDAVSYFCGKILPLIWQKKDSVKLYVVGKSPSAMIKKLAGRDSRVIVTGRVDDVRPYVRPAKAFIVPLRIGGGTRLKILEAMSMSKAVVSTSIGAEGIEYTDGKNILIGDNPQDFADKVLGLMDDGLKSRQIGAEGRKLVCGKYDWDTIGRGLKEVYKAAG
jgi:sugar transferase (PEP-CTERM/EpsH1 system associated)